MSFPSNQSEYKETKGEVLGSHLPLFTQENMPTLMNDPSIRDLGVAEMGYTFLGALFEPNTETFEPQSPFMQALNKSDLEAYNIFLTNRRQFSGLKSRKDVMAKIVCLMTNNPGLETTLVEHVFNDGKGKTRKINLGAGAVYGIIDHRDRLHIVTQHSGRDNKSYLAAINGKVGTPGQAWSNKLVKFQLRKDLTSHLKLSVAA